MTGGRRVWVFGGAGGVGTSTVTGLLALDLAHTETNQSGPTQFDPARSGTGVRVVDWVGDGSPWPAWTQNRPTAAERESRGWAEVTVTPATDTSAGLLAGPAAGWVFVDAGRASLRPDRWDGWTADGPVILVVASGEGPISRTERAARLAATAGAVTVVVTDLCDGRRPAAVKAGVASLAAHYPVINVGYDRALRVGGLARPGAVSARTWRSVGEVVCHLHRGDRDGRAVRERAAVDLRAGDINADRSPGPVAGTTGEGRGAVRTGAEREEIRG